MNVQGTEGIVIKVDRSMLCNSNMNNDVGEGLRMYVNNIMTIIIVFRLIQMNSTTWWLFGMVNLANLVYG